MAIGCDDCERAVDAGKVDARKNELIDGAAAAFGAGLLRRARGSLLAGARDACPSVSFVDDVLFDRVLVDGGRDCSFEVELEVAAVAASASDDGGG
jgi:hypothetical protein